MASIDQDIYVLYQTALAKNVRPTILLIPHQRCKEFVEWARTQQTRHKLILPTDVVAKAGQDIGVQHLLGMAVHISLGDKVAVQWAKGEGIAQQ